MLCRQWSLDWHIFRLKSGPQGRIKASIFGETEVVKRRGMEGEA